MFHLYFHLDCLGEPANAGAARILRRVADAIEAGRNDGDVTDPSGNIVGSYLLGDPTLGDPPPI